MREPKPPLSGAAAPDSSVPDASAPNASVPGPSAPGPTASSSVVSSSATSSPTVSFGDEPLILVDQDDNELGFAPKDQCHEREGRLHRAFSVFLFDTTGEVVLQQRSGQKRLWPLTWSNACCSHPRRGESVPQAVARRLREELGIIIPAPGGTPEGSTTEPPAAEPSATLASIAGVRAAETPLAKAAVPAAEAMAEAPMVEGLTFLFKFRYQAGFNTLGAEHELCHVYAGSLRASLRPNSNEIAAIKTLTPADLDRELETNAGQYTPWLKLEWQRIRASHWEQIKRPKG